MKQILHIIRFKTIQFFRLEQNLSLTSIIRNIAGSLIYIAFGIGAFWFSKAIIRFLLVQVTIGQFLLHEFISMILFIFFIAVNVGNLIVSYSTLYRSNEVTFLLSKPINPLNVFVIKFLDNFLYSSSTMLMVLFALLLGYTIYFNLTLTSFLLIVINFIPFIISSGSLGVIILITFLLLANKYGIKKIFYLLITGYVSTVFFFFKINSPRMLVKTILHYYPFQDKDKYLGELIPSIVKLLPNEWLAQTAYSILHNQYERVLYLTLAQVSLSIILFYAALQFGKRFYFFTWLINSKLLADLNSNKRNIKYDFSNKSFIPIKIYSIIKKDVILFIREPSQIIHFSVLIFLIIVFIASVAGIRFVGIGNYYLQTMIYLAIIIFNLLLITTLSLRFVFPLISLEGVSFWKIKSSPISIKEFIFSKLWVIGLIILAINTVLSIFTNIKFGFQLLLFSFITTTIATITIIAINFGMGALFVNYKEKNPIRISSSQGASICFLINVLYMLFLIVLMFKPFSSLFLSIMIKKYYNTLGIYYYLIPMIIVSAIINYGLFKIVIKTLKKDF